MEYLTPEVVGSLLTALVPLLFKKVRAVLSRPFRYLYRSLTLPHSLDLSFVSLTNTLERLESKTDTLVHQVTTNGGRSLVDTLNIILLQAFIESESRRKLMDAYGFAFWESDREGRCVYASTGLAELIGLPPHEILGDGWVTNLKPDQRQEVKDAWDASVREKRRFTANYTFVHEDGLEVEVQGLSFPIIHNQKTEGFVGILTRLN